MNDDSPRAKFLLYSGFKIHTSEKKKKTNIVTYRPWAERKASLSACGLSLKYIEVTVLTPFRRERSSIAWHDVRRVTAFYILNVS